jgi:hypothetical protein
MLPSPQHNTFKTVISIDLKTATLSPRVIAVCGKQKKTVVPHSLFDTGNKFQAV